ncbi:hypothetical protein JTB14_017564 [Gonioctena quinquepunctata]|nr:hypothetical protein JTB14_017564 [Gonioctena quinquepunctata]
MAKENVSYVEAKQANIASYSNAVMSKNKFETLDLLSDEHFPGLPQGNFRQSRRQPTFQPSTSQTATFQQRKPSKSLPELPNKKRKAQSPAGDHQLSPMLSFSFGPSQPLPYHQNQQAAENLNRENLICNFFKLFQRVLCDVNTFEDLANIDLKYIKKIVSDYPTRVDNEQDEY